MSSFYRPHGERTQNVYDELLSMLKALLPPDAESGVLETTEEVLRLAKHTELRDIEKRAAISDVLGTSSALNDEVMRKVLELAGGLDDYVGGGATFTSQEEPVAPEEEEFYFDEEAEEDENEAGSDDDGLRHSKFAITEGMALGVDEDADEIESMPLGSVGYDYVKQSLRTMFPAETPVQVEEREGLVVGMLSDKEIADETVETQLTVYLDAFSRTEVSDWVSNAVRNRWRIVYGQRLSAAGTDDDKIGQVTAAIKQHGLSCEAVEAIWISLGNERLTKPKVAVTDSRAARGTQPLEKLDLEGLKFSDAAQNAAPCKPVLAKGTRRIVYDHFDEIVVPLVRPFNGEVSFVEMSRFPPWARQCFPSEVKRLNAMQSKVFDASFNGSENLLICAPTGAGKTNIALMALLRVLKAYRDEENDSFHYDDFKMVYVAPMKALVQEVTRRFSALLEPLGVTVAELSGDSALDKEELLETNMIVTTPEKWDIVTRKAIETGVASVVRLVIIDEIHLLHNDRGPVLEVIVARTLRQQQLTQEPIRLVGLSATLPNYGDVGALLRVKPKTGLFHFDASFRPLPLQQSFCTVKKKGVSKRANMLNDVAYTKAMEHAGQNQVIIFVHGRKDTVHTARYLLEKAVKDKDRKDQKILKPHSESKRILAEEAAGLRNDALKELLLAGFGVHHAGMSKDERALVERLFLERHIQILVSTSTLAWGVNLPAHAVIIKGTAIYAPEKGGWARLSALDVFQMFGRAGRPPFDTFGEASIITTPDELEFYLSLLNQQFPIESQLIGRLTEMVNAEVVLGTIRNIDDGVAWLERSYLYVRMRNNPRLYGISREKQGKDPLLKHHCASLIHTAFIHLHNNFALKYDYKNEAVTPTPLGRIASYFNLSQKSIATYNRHMKQNMDDIEVFRLFAMSDEFHNVTVRAEERDQLKRLLQQVPIAVKEGPESPLAKVSVLLQCFITGMGLQGTALMSEMAYIRDSAERISKAMHEIALVKRWASVARKFHELHHMVRRRQWAVLSPLRQIPDFPRDSIRKIESRKLDWESFYYLEEDALAGLVGASTTSDIGAEIFAAVHRIPRLEVTAIAQPLTRSTLRVELEITPDFDYQTFHGRALTFQLTCEDSSGIQVLFSDTFELSSSAILSGNSMNFFFSVPVLDPHPTHYIIRVQCNGWLGAESIVPVDLMPIILPEKAPLPTDASTTALLPTSKLGEEFEELFDFSSFNSMQSYVFNSVASTHNNKATAVFVGMPPGSGRSVVAEMAWLPVFKPLMEEGEEGLTLPDDANTQRKALYVVPSPLKAARRAQEWSAKYGVYNVKVAALQGDNSDVERFHSSAIVVATTDHLLHMQRRLGKKTLARLWNTVALLVVDDLQRLGSGDAGPSYEALLHRLSTDFKNAAASHQHVPRLVALSTPLISCGELCNWLGIAPEHCFNFGVSNRHFAVKIETCDILGYQNRMAHYQRKVFRFLNEPAHGNKSHLIFVPTATDAVRWASHFFEAYRSNNNDVAELCEDIEDDDLAVFLTGNVAFLHSALSVSDQLQVLAQASCGGESPLVCFVTFGLAIHLPAGSFDMAYLCGSEYPPETGALRGKDCSVADMMAMTSRAKAHCLVFCQSPRERWWSQFLYENYPLESMLDQTPEDAVCALASDGTINHIEGVVRFFLECFYIKRLQRNPNFYGLPQKDGETISAHLSELAERTLQTLVEANCVEWDEQSGDVRPTVLGMTASRNALSTVALEPMIALIDSSSSGSGSETDKQSLSSVLYSLCSSPYFHTLGPISRQEENSLKRLLGHLPVSLVPHEVLREPATPTSRAFLLLMAHYSRMGAELVKSISVDLWCQLQTLVPLMLKLVRSAVEVITRKDVPLAMQLMKLSQCTTMATWEGASPLLQLPHLTRAHCQYLQSSFGVSSVEGLSNLEEERAKGAMEGLKLKDGQMEELVKAVNSIPNIELECEGQLEGFESSESSGLSPEALTSARCVVRVLIKDVNAPVDDEEEKELENSDPSEQVAAEVNSPWVPQSPLTVADSICSPSLPRNHPSFWLLLLRNDTRSTEAETEGTAAAADEGSVVCAMRYLTTTVREELTELKFPLPPQLQAELCTTLQEQEGKEEGAVAQRLSSAFTLRVISDAFVGMDLTVDSVPFSSSTEEE